MKEIKPLKPVRKSMRIQVEKSVKIQILKLILKKWSQEYRKSSQVLKNLTTCQDRIQVLC